MEALAVDCRNVALTTAALDDVPIAASKIIVRESMAQFSSEWPVRDLQRGSATNQLWSRSKVRELENNRIHSWLVDGYINVVIIKTVVLAKWSSTKIGAHWHSAQLILKPRRFCSKHFKNHLRKKGQNTMAFNNWSSVLIKPLNIMQRNLNWISKGNHNQEAEYPIQFQGRNHQITAPQEARTHCGMTMEHFDSIFEPGIERWVSDEGKQVCTDSRN